MKSIYRGLAYRIKLKIKRIIQQRNWTQTEIAEIMDMKQQTLNKTLNNSSDLKISFMEKFAKAADTSIGDLIPDSVRQNNDDSSTDNANLEVVDNITNNQDILEKLSQFEHKLDLIYGYLIEKDQKK